MAHHNSQGKLSKMILSAASRRKHIKSIKKRLVPREAGLDPESTFLHRTAVVLMTALLVGTDINALARITGYPLDFLHAIARRMRAAKLWTNGRVEVDDWLLDQSRHLPVLIISMLVAMGWLVRWQAADGRWFYRASRLGARKVGEREMSSI